MERGGKLLPVMRPRGTDRATGQPLIANDNQQPSTMKREVRRAIPGFPQAIPEGGILTL